MRFIIRLFSSSKEVERANEGSDIQGTETMIKDEGAASDKTQGFGGFLSELGQPPHDKHF